jgi:hypothetical protein
MLHYAVIALFAAVGWVSTAQAQSAPACPAKTLSGTPPLSLFAYDASLTADTASASDGAFIRG